MIDSVTGIIIVAVVIGLLFGAKKLPEMAKSFGKATGEFQKGKIEAQKEIDDMKKAITEPVNEVKNTVAEIKKS